MTNPKSQIPNPKIENREPVLSVAEGSKIINVLWFAFASLVAVVILESNALLGLGAAIVGGIVFGILLFVKAA